VGLVAIALPRLRRVSPGAAVVGAGAPALVSE
jgi:hypothetical protein